MKGRRGNPGLKGRLVDKSVEAFILALETINRISIQYRIETFCYLICNAWELLLKAKIIEDTRKTHSIYYSTQREKPKRSLSLQDCLKRIMPNEKVPMRRNVERIRELRDEATHLVIGQIPAEVISLFQANVVNFHNCLTTWFDMSLTDRVPGGLMSIVYDMSPEQSDMTDKRLRRKLGADAATFLARFCGEVKHEFDELEKPAQFLIGIDYRLVLTNRPDEADITLSSGPGGKLTHIVEVPKDPSRSHPFRQKEVIEKVNELLNGSNINQYDIRCINKVYKTKSKSEYFYQGSITGSPAQYSQNFVDWIVRQCHRDKDFFVKTRTKAKN